MKAFLSLTSCLVFSEATVYEFGWLDGSEVKFENWNDSPTEIADHRCVEMREDGSWINHDCSEVHGYVCMKTKKSRECPPDMFWVRHSVGSFLLSYISGVLGRS